MKIRQIVNKAQFSSVPQSCPTLCDPMDCSMPGFSVHNQLPEPTQTHVHWIGDAIQPLHPLSSPSPSAFNVSQYQGLFQWLSSSHQVAKLLEFSFSNSPSNEYSGLISFRIDWLDLFAVQGTLKSLLQHHSSNINSLALSFLHSPTHIHTWPLEKVRDKTAMVPVPEKLVPSIRKDKQGITLWCAITIEQI